ncbi:PIG-L deacetylase family protein [Micromonospora sp. NBC_01796]|uniref:PIG-L deacetylase family protein n=1 Tax=Micromonospora sp. NBC_01796 TaxID=2975987 RepID=UPI002DD8EE85|nr:PIG-L deacetylase family protein [Micromonospora sp. NBC_01796]WSA88168.1 PIG-L family deacetylase [Micromonospora sp. NBC_01796]
MTVSLSAPLLVALLAAATAATGADRPLRRRFRRPRLIQVLAVGAALVLVPANAAYGLASESGPDRPAGGTATGVQLASLVVLCGLAGLCGVLRIAPAPTRLPRRVLAIGAHPDDLELACGGTLLRLVDSGHEVHVLVMSHGGRGGDGDVRAGEAESAGRFLGASGIEVLDLPDTRLARHENEMAEAIERTIRRHRPDLVFTHSGNDQHQDHRAVHLATLRAARQHPAVLCYESPSVTAEFRPSVFVDISDQLDAKVCAVATHHDQRAKPYVGERQVRGLAAFRGGQARVPVAEAFEPVRMSVPLVEEH